MAENRNQDPNQGDRQRGRQDEDLGNRMERDRDRTLNREQVEQGGSRSGGQRERGTGGFGQGTGHGGDRLLDDDMDSDR